MSPDQTPLFVDRHGQRITVELWVQLFEDAEGRVLAEDTFGPVIIRTMWTGVNDPLTNLLPFGSVRVDSTDPRGVAEMRQYTTESAALAGHQELVAEQRRVSRSADES